MKATITALIAVLGCTLTLVAQEHRIGAINFYGYLGLDLTRLRAELPWHEGDIMPSRDQLRQAQEAYAKAIGRSRVKFTPNCCLPDGRLFLFVGIAEPEAAPILFNPRPAGDAQLPGEVVKLSQAHGREIGLAVQRNENSEDDSHGYRLLGYPPARAVELKIREYARARPTELLKVLAESADDTQRAAAAEALGYADESAAQIAALVEASFDRNAEVRDNANRALGILVAYDPKLLKQVPLKRYLALLHSIDWLDRNKAADLVDTFTRTRDPEVLRIVRAEAITPLREIVQWKDFSHAFCAFEVLGRIAGWEEGRIVELSLKQDVDSVLQATSASLKP